MYRFLYGVCMLLKILLNLIAAAFPHRNRGLFLLINIAICSVNCVGLGEIGHNVLK